MHCAIQLGHDGKPSPEIEKRDKILVPAIGGKSGGCLIGQWLLHWKIKCYK